MCCTSLKEKNKTALKKGILSEIDVPLTDPQKKGSRWSLSGWAIGLHDGCLFLSLTVATHAPPVGYQKATIIKCSDEEQGWKCWACVGVTWLLLMLCYRNKAGFNKVAFFH